MPNLQALAGLFGQLWRTGNTWARWAVGLAAAWPPFLALTALLGSQALTATIGLVPIAGLVFVLVALMDPLVVPVVALVRQGRTGLQWISTVFAIELLMAIYFALVPVHLDPGLVPLLLLVLGALLFLSLGLSLPALEAVRSVLVLALIVITFVFFAGGRDEAIAMAQRFLQ